MSKLRASLASIGTLLALTALAQTPASPPAALDADALGFERVKDGRLEDWRVHPQGAVSSDTEVRHAGTYSARMEATAAQPFVSLAFTVPIDFKAQSIELRAWLRREGGAMPMLWLRQDANGQVMNFVLGAEGPTNAGTWSQHSLRASLLGDARQLVLGVRLGTPGKAWVDDLELLVDGKPLALVSRVPIELTPQERDLQFVNGSQLQIEELDAKQIRALVMVGKVWGFLKYHHPAVTSGKKHWDFELLRQLPAMLAAREAFNVRMLLVRWIDSLGPVPRCSPCVTLDVDAVQLQPHVAWITNEKTVGAELSKRLVDIYRNRAPAQQFHVRLTPGIGNPQFVNELPYAQVKFPDAGFQVLGIFRFWNAIEYWFPYRDLIDEKWDEVLADTLRRAAPAMESAAYQRELMRLVARVHDGHATVTGTVLRYAPIGPCHLPVSLRYVDDRYVVERLLADDEWARRFQPGDVLEKLDGRAVNDIIAGERDTYGASTGQWLMFAISRNLTKGECGDAKVAVTRGSSLEFTARRVEPKQLLMGAMYDNDRDGDTFQQLSADVAYLKLSSIKAEEVAGYIERAAGTRALIIDIRNYPSAFVVFSLGGALVDAPTPFVRFTLPDLSNPGAFTFGASLILQPAKPHYAGQVAVLVDETSISNAEYTAMAFGAAPRARVIGRRTAGADGNVSPLALPGGLYAAMSGIGVFYPDNTPTQRRGVALDVECPVTVAGLRAGRDEVLECALKDLKVQ
jgi:hypothetical protein